MKSLYYLLPFLFLSLACSGTDVLTEKPPSLFNGQDLSGWEGDGRYWRVEEGMLVGQAEQLPHNQFLRSTREVGDFRLRLDVRLAGGQGNSGIQFRSTALPGGHVRGPQADIGRGYWGKLYEELGRGWLWEQGCDRYVDPDGWNHYEVVAVGSRVRTAVNGHRCVDLDDPYLAREGIIALQLHAGFGPIEISFRNFSLERDPEFRLITLNE